MSLLEDADFPFSPSDEEEDGDVASQSEEEEPNPPKRPKTRSWEVLEWADPIVPPKTRAEAEVWR